MIFAWDNLLDAATLTESSQDNNYPAENTQNSQLARVWKTTGVTSENIVIDLLSAASVTFAAVLGHNLTSSATLKIQGNATNAWGAPTVDETITIADLAFKSFTGASLRYWRFTFADATNTDGYLKVGRLYVGPKLTPAAAHHVGFTEARFDTSETFLSVSGQVFGDIGVEGRLYDYSLPILTNTEKGYFTTMYATTKKVKPFIVVPDTANPTTYKPIYCVFVDPPSFTHIFNLNWTGSMQLREVF